MLLSLLLTTTITLPVVTHLATKFIMGKPYVKENVKGTIQLTIYLSVFCCYIVWLIVLLSQLNPLILPQIVDESNPTQP